MKAMIHRRPIPREMETGIEGSFQLWSVSGCVDALWVCQLIGLQPSNNEVGMGSRPWSYLLSISPIIAVQLSISHGGPGKSTAGGVQVSSRFTCNLSK